MSKLSPEMAGGVTPDLVGALFEAARLLYEAAPWRVAHEEQLLRIDIPELAVDGACLSILGSLGESHGFLLFPSLEAHVRFTEAVEALPPGELPPDLATGWLSLSYMAGSELPPGMHDEIRTHGWRVAAPEAYPALSRHERDARAVALEARDLRIATACAGAVAEFAARHGGIFEKEAPKPVRETHTGPDGIEVSISAPYTTSERFEPELPAFSPGAPAQRIAKVGRNDPCPCGSGRKYKNCCLATDEAQRREERRRQELHVWDHEIVSRLWEYAALRFGAAFREMARDFDDLEAALQLAAPWGAYGFPVEGRSVVDWFLEEHAERLSGEQRAWLEAQRDAWLSLWEVLDVEPGSLRLVDVFSEEERLVAERRAAESLQVGHVILARVVAHGELHLLAGLHPRPLRPLAAADAVDRARKRLRRKGAVPVERLRDGAFGRYLIRRWEEAVAADDAAPVRLPSLQNTDGDPLLFTVDRYTLEPGSRAEVEARLQALAEVEEPLREDGQTVVEFLRAGNAQVPPLETIVAGRAVVADGELLLETNSVARADALRARVEAVAGELLRHRERTHREALTGAAQPHGAAGLPGAEPVPPGMEQLPLDLKARR